MIPFKRLPLLGPAVIAFLCSGVVGAQQPRPGALPTTREVPNAFGTNAYTVTTISATSFTGKTSSMSYVTSPSLGRYGGVDQFLDYFVGLDLPAGAVIDKYLEHTNRRHRARLDRP